jgi:hypothetical protein
MLLIVIAIGIVLLLIESYSIRVKIDEDGFSIHYSIQKIDSDRNYYYEEKIIWLWKKYN